MLCNVVLLAHRTGPRQIAFHSDAVWVWGRPAVYHCVLPGVGLLYPKASVQSQWHPLVPGTAPARLLAAVGVLSLRHQPVNLPTVVYGAFLLPLQDPFALPGVVVVCWLAGPGPSPG